MAKRIDRSEVSFLLHALLAGAMASYVHMHSCDMHGVRQSVWSPTVCQ